MQFNLPRFTFSEQMIIASIGILFLLLIISQPALASSTTTAGGLSFDSWFTKIRDSITGPFAFTASIVGLVALAPLLFLAVI